MDKKVLEDAPGFDKDNCPDFSDPGWGQGIHDHLVADFALTPSPIFLDEVVVTGTGQAARRRQLGNTIATGHSHRQRHTGLSAAQERGSKRVWRRLRGSRIGRKAPI